MGEAVNWRCPFCNQFGTITAERTSTDTHFFNHGNRHGMRGITTTILVCSNPECREFSLNVVLSEADYRPNSGIARRTAKVSDWQLLPAANIRPFPDYIPSPILQDYREACLIRDLSPKASATLSRRCLQGIIRDFWGVSKPRLVEEILAIKDKVDTDTWEAIDAVRSIGNVGAHMERDINVVVDVDPDEATLLIGLIETLLTEWYVGRFERTQRMAKVVAAAAAKKPNAAQP
jgi:hypothetical protein